MTQQPARRGRPRDPWNQTAIARLRRGDNPAAVRHQWRLAYAQGAGYPPDQTETGEPKLWQTLIIRPYRTQPTTTTQETHQETHP